MYPEINVLSFTIDSFLILYFIAFATVCILACLELKRNEYSMYLFVLLVCTGTASGLIGSKIYYIVETWDQFVQSPWPIFFSIAGSGWYGGFILAAFSVVLVLKITHNPVWKILDVIIPAVPLGQALGRLGCFLTGCCHGTPSNAPWAIPFPNGLYPPYIKVHPTQLYESLWYSGIFIILWKLRKKEKKDGFTTGLYLVLACLGRFLVEFYRLEPKILIGLTAPQFFAFLGILVGVFLIIRGHSNAGESQEIAVH